MALDKHQLREVKQYARDNDLSEAEALKALHPDEAPARAKAAVAVKKEPAPAS